MAILNGTDMMDSKQNWTMVFNHKAYQAAQILMTYMTPVILVIGFAGSILSIFVMSMRHNRKRPTCIYLLILALLDTTILILGTVEQFNLSSTQKDVDPATKDRICQFGSFIYRFTSWLSTFLIALIAVERLSGVYRPFRARMWFRMSNVKYVILILIILSIIVSLPVYFTSKWNNTDNCAPFVNQSIMSSIYFWFMWMIEFVFSRSCMVIMNCLLAFRLNGMTDFSSVPFGSVAPAEVIAAPQNEDRVSHISCKFMELNNRNISESDSNLDRRRRAGPKCTVHFDESSLTKKNDTSEGQGNGERKQMAKNKTRRKVERRLSIMLIAICSAYIALTMPIYIRYVVYRYIDPTLNYERLAYYKLFLALTSRLFYVNSAINFYLYCMTNKRFRKDIKRLFSFCTCLPRMDA